MLCDELKVYVPQDGPWGLEPEEGGKLVEEETCYLKSEVDAAIAELKQKLEDVQASAYAESVDAGMENRRLKEERRWRSVSEELPEVEEGCGEIFLVAVAVETETKKGSYVTSAEFCDGEWYNDATGNEIEENIEREDFFYRSKITHWMQMPEAPKEAK